MLFSAVYGHATRVALRVALTGFLAACAFSPANATVIRMETSVGDIHVRLFDTATPITRDNFVGYAERGDYDGSVIHRSVPGFIVQGGGFVVDDTVFPEDDPNRDSLKVPQEATILNEPGISNLRGTIAMAKVGAQLDAGGTLIPGTGADSATNQWFFSVDDNSANLDNQNGGFTVFGRVVGDGMTVVDSINNLPRFNLGGAFTNYPVTDVDQVQTQFDVTSDESVVVTAVNVLDIPAADYNFDGLVNAADYSIWRDTNGSTTLAQADGNGDGVVDTDDYDLWVAGFGGIAAAAAAGIPEPTTLALVGLGLSALGVRRHA